VGSPAGSLQRLIVDAAVERPDGTALIYRDRPISHAELAEWVGRAASALSGLGVGKGDRVALLVGNVPEFVYALFGALSVGAVAAPLNVLLTPEELGYILADCEAKVVVVEISLLPTVLAVRDRVASIEHVLVVGPPPTPRGTRSLDELMDAAAGEAPQAEVGEDDLAVLAYTAGTTASPKGAMLTHGNLLSNLRQVREVGALRQKPEDVVLLALPLFHIYGLNAVLGVSLMEQATALLVERFDPRETLDLVKRHGVTVLVGAPPMFQAWLAGAAQEDLSAVRMAVSGAAPLPAEVLEAFREKLGLTIWEGYGLTEAAPVVTTNALGPEPKGDSIGIPLPGLEVRLLDEDGEDAVDGDPGEIVVRGPNIFRGYWNRPEESEAVLRDGWLHTGDVAYRDDEGFLFLVDRKKDLVIVSGFNVFPKEVEDAILAHPRVSECVVVGVADDRTGEAVKAFVVPVPGEELTVDEILDHCAGRLARFKIPRHVDVVEELPKHVTGKVLRRELREEAG
jgi:long-chain acyl-CoA synthetase